MVNDITLAGSIMAIMTISAILIGFVQAEANAVTLNSHQQIVDEAGIDMEQLDKDSDLTMRSVGDSLFKMYFWYFDDIPFYLNAFFNIMRLMLVFIIARNIWVGGGA